MDLGKFLVNSKNLPRILVNSGNLPRIYQDLGKFLEFIKNLPRPIFGHEKFLSKTEKNKLVFLLKWKYAALKYE